MAGKLTLRVACRRWALPPLPAWVTTCAAVLCAVNVATGAVLAAKHSRWAPWLLPFHNPVPLNEPSEPSCIPGRSVLESALMCMQYIQLYAPAMLTCWISCSSYSTTLAAQAG